MFFRASHCWSYGAIKWIYCSKENLLELQDYCHIINLDQTWIPVQELELLNPTAQDKLKQKHLATFTDRHQKQIYPSTQSKQGVPCIRC